MTDLFSMPLVRPNARWESPVKHDTRPRLALTRTQVVDQILTINRSATAEYLEQFREPELNTYLEHLLNAQEPRGREARWDRPGDAPAIMTRRRAS